MGKDNCEPVDREKDGLVEEVNSHKWRKGGWGIISCMWDLTLVFTHLVDILDFNIYSWI